MADSSSHSAQLLDWLSRMRAGDPAAKDDLLRGVGGRLEQLARGMLRRFPHLRRWTETADVLQSATVRLLRALEEVQPPTARAFFGLAAEQLRRELLDLARHYYGAYGPGTHHASGIRNPDGQAVVPDAEAPADDPSELERWCRFHQAVERLPAQEREIVGLIYYHGWTRGEVAELLGIHERTVRRRWEDAMELLYKALHEAD